MPKLTTEDANLYVRPFEETDTSSVAPVLRQSDVIEVAAMMGPDKTTEEHLTTCVERSRETYSIIYDGNVMSIFGVSDSAEVQGFGVPWLVASDAVEEVGYKFVKYSKQWVAHMSRNYEALYNFVHVPHWQAQKWLQLLGFNIVTTLKYGFNNEDFYLFIKECK